MNNVSQAYVDAALEIADLAREISLKYFRQPLDTVKKEDESPVTIADQQTEALIRSEIERRFPDHGFYGEESGQSETDATWVWVVDPIDGTTSFATGKPTFGTLIALLYEGKPVLGVVDLPALDDRWLGINGQATLYNGEAVLTSKVNNIADSSVYTTKPTMITEDDMPRYMTLSGQCKFSVFGADCLGYGLLSSGFTEIVLEASLEPYDYMALVPVIEGAGGCISDWDGREIDLQTADRILATANAELHQKALAALQR